MMKMRGGENGSQPISVLWPFMGGFILKLIILAIVFFGKEPSPTQFMIYRIVIALAGAGFAVTLTGQLEVYMPLMRKGYVKAASGFAVFVILFFFTPATLVSDKNEQQSLLIVDEYFNPNSKINHSLEKINSYWRVNSNLSPLVEGFKPVYAANSQIALDTENKDEKLTKNKLLFASEDGLKSNEKLIKNFVRSDEYSPHFLKVMQYHENVFTCVAAGFCDPGILCSLTRKFFESVENFRTLYCGEIIDRSREFGRDIWESYNAFVTKTCKAQFLMTYIEYDDIINLKEACIPVQCWAKNVRRPYPCETRRQIQPGILIPG